MHRRAAAGVVRPPIPVLPPRKAPTTSSSNIVLERIITVWSLALCIILLGMLTADFIVLYANPGPSHCVGLTSMLTYHTGVSLLLLGGCISILTMTLSLKADMFNVTVGMTGVIGGLHYLLSLYAGIYLVSCPASPVYSVLLSHVLVAHLCMALPLTILAYCNSIGMLEHTPEEPWIAPKAGRLL